MGLGAGMIPRVDGLHTDIPLFLFAWTVAGFALVFSSILPTVSILRGSKTATVHAGREQVTPGSRAQRARSTLVVVQISLSFVLLVGAGLLIQTLWNLQRIDPGIRTEQLLTFRLSPSRGTNDLVGFYEEVTASLASIPGVASASAVNTLPLTGNLTAAVVSRDGLPATAGADGSILAEARSVTPQYFSTVGMTVGAGRQLSADDDEAHPLVAIVNETFVRAMFDGENPVGRLITVGDDPSWVETTRVVVGVVSDVTQVSLAGPSAPVVYIPHAQEVAPWRRRSMMVVVRTDADPLASAPAVRGAVWRIDETAPITDLRSAPSIVAAQVSQPRLRAFVLVAFALLAATVTGVGILGAATYAVTRRVREIGVRLALGAQRRDVLSLVVGQGARVTAIGITLGVIAALALTRLLSSVLYGIPPIHILTFAGVTLLLAALSLAANYFPARRASRVDPVDALRVD
jgi:predicted permease